MKAEPWALWDYSTTWYFLIQLGVIFVSIVLGNLLRRKIKFIKSSLLPASVIAGLIVFGLKFIPGVSKYVVDAKIMESIFFMPKSP